jgi:hypothetical protein
VWACATGGFLALGAVEHDRSIEVVLATITAIITVVLIAFLSLWFAVLHKNWIKPRYGQEEASAAQYQHDGENSHGVS